MQNKNNPEGHEGPARRFVQFGGGIGAEQLDWFVQQLSDARATDQRVIVCGHLPVHPGTCIGTCLLWNYEEVLQAIWDAGNVVATISGHAHHVSLCTPMHYFPCVRQATVMHCVQAACADLLLFQCKRVWLTHCFFRSCCQHAISCFTPCAVFCQAVHVGSGNSALRLFAAVLWIKSCRGMLCVNAGWVCG